MCVEIDIGMFMWVCCNNFFDSQKCAMSLQRNVTPKASWKKC